MLRTRNFFLPVGFVPISGVAAAASKQLIGGRDGPTQDVGWQGKWYWGEI